MQIKPIKDQVLVRQDKPAEKLGSLYIPDARKRELQGDFGTVIAVGPGRTGPGGQLVSLDVSVGDRVLFKRTPGTALMPDRKEIGVLDVGREDWADLLMLNGTEDILAVVESE